MEPGWWQSHTPAIHGRDIYELGYKLRNPKKETSDKMEAFYLSHVTIPRKVSVLLWVGSSVLPDHVETQVPSFLFSKVLST